MSQTRSCKRGVVIWKPAESAWEAATADILTAGRSALIATALGCIYDKYMGSIMTNVEEMAQQMRAHIAALTAERDYTQGTNEVLRSENQRLEAERDALKAQLAEKEEQLVKIKEQTK